MRRVSLLIFMILTAANILAQHEFRIISYNVENLFDYEDDPDTQDEAFTPTGDYKWTEKKYKRKLNDVSKVLSAAGEWTLPAIIALCEIENARVLDDLTTQTQLKTAGYKYLHRNSPDRRGVDVALLYQPDKYKVSDVEFLTVKLPDEERPTREILFASGVVPSGDTLHIFVNHWPSRYGGELESQHKRISAAQAVRQKVDSLFFRNSKAKIAIMGDFNDYPTDKSIADVLKASTNLEDIKDNELYNLMAKFDKKQGVGTHKFGGEWGVLDHVIVSGSMLDQQSGIHTSAEKVHIYKESFLLKPDKTDFAPKRSFLGAFYAYGFSDHLPVYLDLNLKQNNEKH